MPDDTHTRPYVDYGSSPFGHTETVAQHPLTPEQIDHTFGDDLVYQDEECEPYRHFAYMNAYRALMDHKTRCGTCLENDSDCVEGRRCREALNSTRQVES